jgi:hypothetical protein
MDVVATILAGITVLSIPFLLLFRSKARLRHERDLAEIKGLVAERSQYVDELHTRLDTLERKDFQRESAATEEETFNRRRMRDVLLAYEAATWQDIAAKENLFADLDLSDLEALGAETRSLRTAWILHFWVMESKAGPEWIKDADLDESAEIEDLRRKGTWKRGSAGLLGGPVPQGW